MNWNSSCCSREISSKNVLLWKHLAMTLSLIFQFQLVPLVFILILGEPLISLLLWVQQFKNWLNFVFLYFSFFNGLIKLLHFLYFKLISILVTCLRPKGIQYVWMNYVLGAWNFALSGILSLTLFLEKLFSKTPFSWKNTSIAENK